MKKNESNSQDMLNINQSIDFKAELGVCKERWGMGVSG